ncbi:uncharacterized protein LOC114715961 [Neltuma alba]|uniref:uncharacterized protein LOC114715961 n=1 Tax=Neltuma alba TaxID=207710 RepID=UPI0010A3AD25|nr:uncharacterized protein LOC114715961 [Prosopis alba]
MCDGPESVLQMWQVGTLCQGVPDSSRLMSEGRVFALNKEEARRSPEMIQGTISVNDCLVHAIFDSGASHSYISYDYIRHLGLTIDALPHDLYFSTPTDAKVLTSSVCLNCIARYAHYCIMLDLICILFYDIDVIIGLTGYLWIIYSSTVRTKP